MENNKGHATNIKALMFKFKEACSIGELDFHNLFFDLTKQGEIETLFEFQGLCIDLLKLLSNPAISKQLDNFNQDNAGDMLKRLHFFFWCLDKDYDNTRYFLDSIKVTFCNNPSVNLDEIEDYYQKALIEKFKNRS
jgi:hypothetical protein